MIYDQYFRRERGYDTYDYYRILRMAYEGLPTQKFPISLPANFSIAQESQLASISWYHQARHCSPLAEL